MTASSSAGDATAGRGGPSTALLATATGTAVLLVYLVGLGAFHLIDVDEPRFATASRNMIERGDWIVPWFNGAVRYDKPILIYWLQAAAMLVFGIGEFAARLPSAVGIALGSAATVGMARTLGLPPRVAVGAGLILATTPVAQMIGHGATADGLLLGVAASTCWLLLHRSRSQARNRPAVGLWLGVLLGLCFLTKGPPALVAPLALWVGLVRTRRGPGVPEGLLATAVAASVVLAWGIPALVRTDGGFLSEGIGKHVVERSTRGFEGHGGFEPWWYLFYVVAIPAAFLPWSAFGFRTWQAFRRPEGIGISAPDGRTLAWWFGLTFVIFTASTSKLAHYPLPVFPALALWTAAGLGASPGPAAAAGALPRRLGAGVLGTLAAGLGIGLPAFFVAAGMPLSQAAVYAGVLALLGLGTAAARCARGHERSAAAATLLTMLCFWPFVAHFVLPEFTSHTVARHIRELAGDVAPGRPIGLYDLTMPTSSFYLGRDVPRIRGEVLEDGTRISKERKMVQHLLDGGVVVTSRSRLDKHPTFLRDALDALSPEDHALVQQILDHPFRTADAWLVSKGRRLELLRLQR